MLLSFFLLPAAITHDLESGAAPRNHGAKENGWQNDSDSCTNDLMVPHNLAIESHLISIFPLTLALSRKVLKKKGKRLAEDLRLKVPKVWSD